MIVYREFSSLRDDLGISPKTLYTVSNTIGKHYHRVKLKKADGTFRELSVPDELLKEIQRKIVNKLLIFEDVSLYATAYRFGGSIIKNAKVHRNKSVILKLDIKGFFDSINFSLVKERVFPKERYSDANSTLLATLCIYENALPQGAPTSPIISNIIMRDFDTAVSVWCWDRKITYTRYCDDMTFSGEFEPDEVKKFVSDKLKEMGFRLNHKKTRVLHDGVRKSVTGIVVNEKINTAKDYRKKIRQEVYYCKKFGVLSHLSVKEPQTPAGSYLHSLLGRINFVLSVDSGNKEFAEYKKWVINEIKKL